MSTVNTYADRRSGVPAGAIIAGLLADASEALAVDHATARSLVVRAIEMLDSLPADRRSNGLAPWQVHKLERYVDANIANAITLESMAACVRLSASHFGRVFKASLGETPRAYVLRKRVERARQLMTESASSLAEIAIDCGLYDQSHLNRIFRRYSGTSPHAWRRSKLLA
jgi:transcriptional regulator GlxA family with amidase domain